MSHKPPTESSNAFPSEKRIPSPACKLFKMSPTKNYCGLPEQASQACGPRSSYMYATGKHPCGKSLKRTSCFLWEKALGSEDIITVMDWQGYMRESVRFTDDSKPWLFLVCFLNQKTWQSFSLQISLVRCFMLLRVGINFYPKSGEKNQQWLLIYNVALHF